MIRGHIDFASRTRVEGWMHSDVVSVVGARLLAFVDDDCVGEGIVDLYRHDLLEAGIGDGLSGFAFEVHLKDSHDPRVLDVRLDGGSLSLRQIHARLVPQDDTALAQRRAPRDLNLLSWMLARGWMTSEQYDVLHRLALFGVRREPLTFSVADRLEPQHHSELSAATAALFELHMHANVTSDLREDLNGEDFMALRDHLHKEFPRVPPLVALWAPRTNCLNIMEGSHLDLEPVALSTGVDYEFGNDHILWMNLDCQFHVPTGGLPAPVTALFPARR